MEKMTGTLWNRSCKTYSTASYPGERYFDCNKRFYIFRFYSGRLDGIIGGTMWSFGRSSQGPNGQGNAPVPGGNAGGYPMSGGPSDNMSGFGGGFGASSSGPAGGGGGMVFGSGATVPQQHSQ